MALLESLDDPSRTTESIIAALKNTFTKRYLEFMSYVLDLLTEFNTTFQSETPLLNKLKAAVEHLIRTIAADFMELNHVKNKSALNIEQHNPRFYVPLEKLYLRVLVATNEYR